MAQSSGDSSKEKGRSACGSEADRWVLHFAQGELPAEDARAFNQWLLAHPDNEAAFERAQDAYERASYIRNDPRLDEWLRPSLYERINSFRARGAELARPLARPRRAIPALGGLAAVVTGLAAVMVMNSTEYAAPIVPAEPELTTQVAEIRRETLPDGSTVTLGAASSIDIQFTEEARRVVLLEGEAFFEVEKNPDRPFLVVADDMLVRVLGTKFDVSLGVGAVDVAVSEGRVEVIRPERVTEVIDDTDVKHVLTAGQKVTAAKSGRVRPVETIAVEKVAPWRNGELVWENTAISDIVADLNRYSDQRILIKSRRLGDLEYTFSFRASDIDIAVDVIADTLGVQMIENANGEIELR